MSEFQVDSRDTDHANRIMEAMLTDGYVSAKAVSELTGLDQKEAKMLAESMNDDGRISAEELKNMEKSKGSERLLGISRFIGGSASDMYETAQMLRETRGALRCGIQKLGSENVSYADSEKKCWVTAEGTTWEEINAAQGAISRLEAMASSGVDILPAIKIMFEHFERGGSLEGLAMFASKFRFELLNDSQKSELSEFLGNKIRFARIQLDPIQAYVVAKILGNSLGESGKKVLWEIKPFVDNINKKFAEGYGYEHIIETIDELYKTAELSKAIENLYKP